MSELFDDADPSEHKQDTIIDNGTFIAVPTWVYENFKRDLGPLGLAVYVALKSYANRKKGYSTFVAVSSIAKDLKMGISTVRREIGKMEDLKLIRRSFAKGKPTDYYIAQTPPSYRPLYDMEGTPPLYSATPPQNENITIGFNQMLLTRDNEAKASVSINPPLKDERQNLLEEIFKYFVDKIGKDEDLYTLTEKRKKMGLARIDECLKISGGDYTKAGLLMELAIDELAKSDYHMARGLYKKKTKYNDWENVFRSPDMMQKWWDRNDK